jgi:ABC-type Fe3+-hydroxamate transport system substrate-binding protein
MAVYIDQMGRTVELPASPRRIVSLVPSITELLYTLQLEEQVTGITKFCIHPDNWFREKTRVGGTKAIKASVIHELKPDLIIANKEENVKEQVEELAQHYPVWVTDVNNLGDALEMIEQIGAITNTSSAATRLASQINSAFSKLQTTSHQPRTGYLIWRNPYMTIGKDTFIHDMLGRCGFINIFGHTTRYPATGPMRAAVTFFRAIPFSTKTHRRIAGNGTQYQNHTGRWGNVQLVRQPVAACPRLF